MNSAAALLDEALASLTAAGVDSPRVDAELLLAHVLAEPPSPLLRDRALDDATTGRFRALIARRAQREPLQYLTGEAPFRYATLAVGAGVFIPRPETELLIDAVLPALSAVSQPLVVDLCSGSGALAVALAQEVPTASVIAIERSVAALTWLRRNVAGTGITIVAADVTAPDVLDLLSAYIGRVDAVVSNPPYVPAGTPVQAEVRCDPPEAVFAGDDGLDVLPAVIALAGQLLRPGGVFAVEHDETQGGAVTELLRRRRQWTNVVDHLDLTGRSRYTTAVRLSEGAR